MDEKPTLEHLQASVAEFEKKRRASRGESPQDPRLLLAQRYMELATHYESELQKLRRRSQARTERLEAQSGRILSSRPTTIHDRASLTRHYVGDDTWLAEYEAGMQIVGRRATMYACLATALYQQIQTEVALFNI